MIFNLYYSSVICRIYIFLILLRVDAHESRVMYNGNQTFHLRIIDAK